MNDTLRRLSAAIGAAAALLLAGCGGGAGGVDTGGTGAPLAYTRGTISGFGSVIVNGVRFDDRNAEIVDDDGQRRSRGELRLGMQAEIDSSSVTPGSATATGTAVASRIRFSSEMVGGVDAVDTAAGLLTVIGQTVRVTPATVFDDRLRNGLASVAVPSLVEVYARIDAASGVYVATRIEPKSSLDAYRLRGRVEQLDTAAKRLRIGGQTVSYARLGAGDLPAGLANGSFVKLRLLTVQQSGAWVATRMDAGDRQPEDREEARVEGLVTGLLSATRFSVDGVAVDARSARFPDGTAGLLPGALVEVEGRLVGGVLIADEVGIETEDEEIELSGPIESIDPAAQTFAVRGVTVLYDAAVTFDDGTAADLGVGVTVEVRGSLTAGGTEVLATRIRFR